MGGQVDRAAPWYFTKSPTAVCHGHATAPYPPGTQNYHHEVELVVALGPGRAVYGYGVGLDMTRRDLQAVAKDNRRPWDTAKDVEGGAILGPLKKAAEVTLTGAEAIRLDTMARCGKGRCLPI